MMFCSLHWQKKDYRAHIFDNMSKLKFVYTMPCQVELQSGWKRCRLFWYYFLGLIDKYVFTMTVNRLSKSKLISNTSYCVGLQVGSKHGRTFLEGWQVGRMRVKLGSKMADRFVINSKSSAIVMNVKTPITWDSNYYPLTCETIPLIILTISQLTCT